MSETDTPELRETALIVLRRDFPKYRTVTTHVTHVTSSGNRSVLALLGKADGTVEDLSWAVARALGWKFDNKHGGVRVTGGNIDPGFHLVNQLAETLYHDGYALTHRRL